MTYFNNIFGLGYAPHTRDAPAALFAAITSYTHVACLSKNIRRSNKILPAEGDPSHKQPRAYHRFSEPLLLRQLLILQAFTNISSVRK